MHENIEVNSYSGIWVVNLAKKTLGVQGGLWNLFGLK
jgi:hypothetical protein